MTPDEWKEQAKAHYETMETAAWDHATERVQCIVPVLAGHNT